MSQWKPINTAPDDRLVLVSDGKYIHIALWNEEPDIFDDNRPVKGPCWTVFDCDDTYYSIHLVDEPPTHWMPLPEFPK